MPFDPKILDKLRLNLSASQQHLVIRSAIGVDADAAYSFGVEEEYFLADAETYEVAMQTPNGLFETASWSTGGQAMREMLQAQIEVASNVHVDPSDARKELRFLRSEVAAAAAQHGLVIMASATHPTASWQASKPSPKQRYADMIEDLRAIGHRNMLCGMHVHVQTPPQAERVGVMRAMIPYLPLFIALATSSPFWNGKETGLRGYRLAAYDELPRTGLPELFTTQAEYDAYVEALVCSGVMPNESYVWWALRPSFRHPTLELRAPDVCTRLEDAVLIASLYRALIKYLCEHPASAQQVDNVERAIAVENKWRAQRYGTDCVFASKDGPIEIREFLDKVIAQVLPDAKSLGCAAEVEGCRSILEHGNSADAQLRAYHDAGGDLSAVTQWIARQTLGEDTVPTVRDSAERVQ
ncbi:carboxylate-amine ligase [Rhodopseudomonas palustris]|uniref:Putative glutamate--cysteine ligase 2 n=1 Tax=Rhodopseudomonas palustris TaxID=1076 RepID=A0A323UH67_RHOPL|nr:carboxylate-amine ligase [Rhodopseudomonas palustris]PZA12165.1 carboxylate-amine ligase [Rhodopseudomonas palustris]